VGDAEKSHEQQREEARRALESLIKITARVTVDACYKLGIDFDIDDPEVAQEVMKATFEGLFYSKSAPAARSKSIATREASATSRFVGHRRPASRAASRFLPHSQQICPCNKTRTLLR
jgi:hypothetical protein